MSHYDLSENEYLLIGKFIHKYSELEFSVEFTLLSFILPPFNQIQLKDPRTSSLFLASVIIDEHSFSKKITILKNFFNRHVEHYFLSKEDPLYSGKIDTYKDSIKIIKKSLDTALCLGEHRNQLVHSFYHKQENEFFSSRSKVNDKNTTKTEKYSESTLQVLCDSLEKTFIDIHEKSQYLSYLRSDNLKYIVKK